MGERDRAMGDGRREERSWRKACSGRLRAGFAQAAASLESSGTMRAGRQAMWRTLNIVH